MISLDGKGERHTQTVKLLSKVTNETDGSSFMTEKNAMIKISAKETEITGKNAKPQIIPELRE